MMILNRVLHVTFWALVALGVLSLPAFGQSWPNDSFGRSAAQCAAIDANGNPVLCSPTAPLPVTSTPPLAPSTDLYGWGRSWFISGSTLNQGTNMFGGIPLWLDNNSAVIYAGGNTAVFAFKTADGGKSWAQIAITAPVFGHNDVPCGVRAPNGNIVICGRNVLNETVYTSTN